MSFFSARPHLCTAEPVALAVLPFENISGESSLEWLSIGLWDAATSDLWYAEGVRALAMHEILSKERKPRSELSGYSDESAIAFGKKFGLDAVWLGSFEKTGESALKVKLRGLDVEAGLETFRKSTEADFSEILAAVSGLVLDSVRAIGMEVTPERERMMTARKTSSFKAFELNAEGLGIQHELSLRRERQRRLLYDKWTDAFRAATSEDPDYAEAWCNLGWALIVAGDYKGSSGAFENALRMKPYSVYANIGMGKALRKKAESGSAEAFEFVRRAVETNGALLWASAEFEEAVLSSNDPSMKPYLAEFAEGGKKGLRIRALRAIGRTADPSYLPLLAGLLRDADKDVSMAALDAMGSGIGGKEALPYLKEAVQERTLPWETVNAIIKIDRNEALPYLLGFIRDKQSEYRAASAELLGAYRIRAAVPHLIEAVRDDESVSVQAIKSLALLRDSSSVPALIAALRDERVNVRGMAAAALGELGERGSVEALRNTAEQDDDKYVRVRALVSMAGMGEKDAVDSLLGIIKGGDAEAGVYAARVINRRPWSFYGTELEFVLEAVN